MLLKRESLSSLPRQTKLKWNGCIIAGVQEMEKAREGVTILLNDVWHSVC